VRAWGLARVSPGSLCLLDLGVRLGARSHKNLLIVTLCRTTMKILLICDDMFFSYSLISQKKFQKRITD
jgi:hypothetical protein